MAALQAYHLRWNNHQESLLHVFDKLHQAEDFVDVTLCCQGQNIRAHRMVLSACSPFFYDLLREHPAKHPIVILNDVAFADLAILMQFMYKGEADVAADRLDSVLRAAYVLGIKGLGSKQARSSEEKGRYLSSEVPSTRIPQRVGQPARVLSSPVRQLATRSYQAAPGKVPLLDQILKDSLAEPSLSLKRCNITPSMRRILSGTADKNEDQSPVYPILQPVEDQKPSKRSRLSLEEEEASDLNRVVQESCDDVDDEAEVEVEDEAEAENAEENVSCKLEVRIDEDVNGNLEVEEYEDDLELEDENAAPEASETEPTEETLPVSPTKGLLRVKTEFSEVSREPVPMGTPPIVNNAISSSGTASGSSHPSRLTCELCGKECRSPGEKVIHMRSHTGEKPFVCQECGAGFRRSAHLVRHKLLHTGERPHICPICDKGFTRKDKLKYHMSFKHNVEAPSQSSGGVTSSNSGSNGPASGSSSPHQHDDAERELSPVVIVPSWCSAPTSSSSVLPSPDSQEMTKDEAGTQTSPNNRTKRGEKNLVRIAAVPTLPVSIVVNRRKRRSPTEGGFTISNCGFGLSSAVVTRSGQGGRDLAHLTSRSVGKAVDA